MKLSQIVFVTPVRLGKLGAKSLVYAKDAHLSLDGSIITIKALRHDESFCVPITNIVSFIPEKVEKAEKVAAK